MEQRVIKIFGIPVYSEKRSTIESLGTMRDPNQTSLTILGNESSSGVSVNDTTALNISTVFACTRIIANTIQMLPFGVYRKDENGNRFATPKHRAHFLIHDEPNAMMSAQTWRQVMQAQAVLKGNAYSIIKRDASYRPVSIELIVHPENVQPFPFEGRVYYKVVGYDLPFSSDDIFHIKGVGTNGIVGKSVLAAAKESIGTAIAMQRYGGKVFSSGAAKRPALTNTNLIKDPASKKAIIDSFKEAYGGEANSGKVAILDGGFDVKEIGMNPDDAQFVASREFTVNDIARFFGVPMDMLNTDKNPTYASGEQRAIDFVKYTMTPWLTTWESEANRKLFADYEKGSFYTKFSVGALLRGDAKARVDYYRQLFYMGAISRNEIRGYEDMNDIPEGEKLYLQSNLVEADKLNDIHQKNNTNNG